MTFSDRLKVTRLYLARGLKTSMRLSSFLRPTRWRLSGPVSAELLVAPQDMSTADPTLANDIYAGYFSLGGHTIECNGQSPFELKSQPVTWEKALHGFTWLKHMRASDKAVSHVQARLLVDEWIKHHGKLKGVAGEIEQTATRVIAWLSHSPLILEDCDHAFYRRFMKSLSRQVRYLRLSAADTTEGMPRLLVAIALSYAAISMAGPDSAVRNGAKRLDKELNQQILSDGGHVSRNPNAIITILALLLPLRQAIIARNLVPSETLISAIDRLMPMLRFFRLGDGRFAQFNGMGETPLDLVAALIACDDAHGAPVLNASQSGYQRFETSDIVILMDTGKAPPQQMSGNAHAGCLSFEMSAGTEKLVTNCGHLELGTGSATGQDLSYACRTTPAHSTLSINGESSCRFLVHDKLRHLIGLPVLSGPKLVDVHRTRGDARTILEASHDGYAATFGLKHQRTLMIPDHGQSIDGHDEVMTTRNQPMGADNPHQMELRFHLHANVKAALSSSRTVEMTLPSGKRWMFVCHSADVKLEQSVAFSDVYGAQPAWQIVVEEPLANVSIVDWTFQRLS